ncbi:Arc family DNA-binding protein [Massilia aquatica]|uniref:Arc family DNA-binding protein n=1 Tax=Massilia aquatica TaxID=2609000 RepID=A0ABX0M4T9_9BURK|nr:Arc family DNA-binding protein [Massilia aquatica]NHZ40090.1 Arc family DNA-binding protein [Massilia aquatica]
MTQDPKKIVSRESDKFMLRFPEGMREHVADAAARNRRSMNAEILARLEQTFRWDAVGHQHPGELTAEIETSAARLQELVREFRMQQVVISPSHSPLPYIDEEDDVDIPDMPAVPRHTRTRRTPK